MATFGPWDFYRHDRAIYPALLYAYWRIGVLLDGLDQARAIKGLSIPFDPAPAATLVFLLMVQRSLAGDAEPSGIPSGSSKQQYQAAGRRCQGRSCDRATVLHEWS